MDPDNIVVRLCVQGVEAEAAYRHEEARALFETAWRSSRDDLEACIAAHYIARQQPDPETALFWNQLALARADSVARKAPERVRGFYATLHLNLGMAHEKLGQIAHARHHFVKAAAALEDITEGGHRVLVEYSVNRGLERTASYSS
ncbi:MAG TPA: hypothetical protein VFQ53_30725 [Kofleriaceae bacterium]|nr:hypothetical protein [Kofleriaceae bacterium]